MQITRLMAALAIAGTLAACASRPGTAASSLAPGAEWTATIVGKPANYPPLVMSSQGNLSAIAQVPVELVKGTRYVVHLHASPAEMKTVIACAPLIPGDGTAIVAATH